jgi:thiosulfate/3-mercaptopyruvate sulfurtransferase
MPRSGPAPAPTLPFVCRSDYLLSLAQASALTQRPDAALVSIRSRAEWRGETSGYRYIAQRGEIAGALWGHAGHDGDVNSMASFQDATGCMRAAAEIQAMWAEAGIRPGMQIAFYCGTGWRAALAFFYAWLMGWPRISVFDGGWYEWSSDAANPVQNALPCPDRKAFPTPHHDPLPP